MKELASAAAIYVVPGAATAALMRLAGAGRSLILATLVLAGMIFILSVLGGIPFGLACQSDNASSGTPRGDACARLDPLGLETFAVSPLATGVVLLCGLMAALLRRQALLVLGALLGAVAATALGVAAFLLPT
jgi:hypothetical protein